MTSMQQSNVDAEWKPKFLFTAIFGETNQIKCEQLPGRIKEFKPETSKFFSTKKGKKIISTYLFFVITHPTVHQCLSYHESLPITYLLPLTETDETKRKRRQSTSPYPKHSHCFHHTKEASDLFHLVMSDSWQEEYKK